VPLCPPPTAVAPPSPPLTSLREPPHQHHRRRPPPGTTTHGRWRVAATPSARLPPRPASPALPNYSITCPCRQPFPASILHHRGGQRRRRRPCRPHTAPPLVRLPPQSSI
jgi:hypothetical protein